MGYYSSMKAEYIINKDKVEELKTEIKRLNNLKDNEKPEFVDYFLDSVEIEFSNKEYYLLWEDYNCKWYNDEEFIIFIQPFLDFNLHNFYEVYFRGEDSEDWGYKIYIDKIIHLETQWIER